MRRIAIGTLLFAAAQTALLTSWPRDALAQNPHECVMIAVGQSPPPPVGASGTVAYEVTSMTCSIGEPPGLLFGVMCSGAEATTSLNGSFDVEFTPLAATSVELKITNMLLSHPTFELCGHTLELKGHIMPEASQDLLWDSATGDVTGRSVSFYTATIDGLFDARARESGSFVGSLGAPGLLDLDFDYTGTWKLIPPVPILSERGFVAFAVLLLAVGGAVLLRRGRRAARRAA